MNAIGIDQAILVGHSLGCQIVAEAALQHPSRADRLVLIGVTPDPAARSTAIQFRRFLLGGARERPPLSLHLVRDYARMGKRLIPEFQAMLEDPIEDKLPRLRVPVMLVRGERDPIVLQHWVDQAARLLGTDRVIVIPKWGHAVHYSAAGQLVRAIRPFLCKAEV